VLVDSEAFEIFSEGCLDALVECAKVRTRVGLHLSFKAVDVAVTLYVIADHNTVVVNFGVHAGVFYYETLLS
jgi:hypothetical protein